MQPGPRVPDLRSARDASTGPAISQWERSGPIWPTFFLIGAPKAGTTTIFQALARHPEVFCPFVKEPNYFNSDLIIPDAPSLDQLQRRVPEEPAHFACIRDEASYRSLYAEAGHYRAVGDCSVNYLRSKVAAGRIRETVPGARLVAVLRNPVDRAYSHYLMDMMIGRVSCSFGEAIDRQLAYLGRPDYPGESYLEIGLYTPQLQRYLDRFPREQLLVILFEDLVADFAATMDRVFRHIGVEPLSCAASSAAENPGRTARFMRANAILYRSGLKRLIADLVPAGLREIGKRLYYTRKITRRISEYDRVRLRKVFEPDIHRLEVAIGRDLSHWHREPHAS